MICADALSLLMCKDCEALDSAGERGVPELCDVCTAATLCAWEEMRDGLVRTCDEVALVLVQAALVIHEQGLDADGVRAWFARRRLW